MEELLKKWGYYDFLEKIGPSWYSTNLVYRGSNTTIDHVNKILYDKSANVYLVHCYRTTSSNSISKGLQDKWKFINNPKQEYARLPVSDTEMFINTIYIKIKSFELSANLFGFKDIKKQMASSEEVFNISDINKEYSCKDGIKRNIFNIASPNGKNLKFVEDDIEFIYPDFQKIMKGYTPKLDRTIRVGSKVKIRKKNNIGLVCGTKASVLALSKAGNTRYATIAIDNKKEYLIRQDKIRVIN